MMSLSADQPMTWTAYLHPAGVVLSIITIGVLVGMAFRRHHRETPLPWLFAASVIVWAMFHEFVIDFLTGSFIHKGLSAAFPVGVSRYSVQYEIINVLWLRSSAVGPSLSAMIFAVAVSLRHGSAAPVRLVLAVILAAVAQIGGFILLAFAPLTIYPTYIGFQSPWVSFGTMSPEYRSLPNIHCALGWVIWYVALFGGKPARQIDEAA